MAITKMAMEDNESCEILREKIAVVSSERFYDQHPASVNHPERRDGERWLMNDAVDDDYIYTCGYKTLRIGNAAYDIDGKIVEGLRPLFVSEEEFGEGTRLGPPDEDLPVIDDDPETSDPFALFYLGRPS